MKTKKIITASEMGQKGYKTRLKKLGGKKAYSKAMTEAIKKRWQNNSIQKNRERSKRRQRELLLNNPKEYYKKLSLRVKKWTKENPEKVKAHKVIFVEKRAGRIKSKPCFCGKKKTEAHHKDYSKPKKVKWFCKKHHRQVDRNELSTAQQLTHF